MLLLSQSSLGQAREGFREAPVFSRHTYPPIMNAKGPCSLVHTSFPPSLRSSAVFQPGVSQISWPGELVSQVPEALPSLARAISLSTLHTAIFSRPPLLLLLSSPFLLSFPVVEPVFAVCVVTGAHMGALMIETLSPSPSNTHTHTHTIADKDCLNSILSRGRLP